MALPKAVLLWSTLAISIVAQQHVLGAPRRFTLDNIVPSTDPISSQVKCCPEGTQFNETSCSLGIPTCADPDTYYNNGACISKHGPQCPKGRLEGNICVSEEGPSCDPPYKRSGSFCVTEKDPQCRPGFELHGSLCQSTVKPACVVGSPKDDVCVHPERPQCPEGLYPVGATCVKKKNSDCPNHQTFDTGLRRCISKEGPLCPVDAVPVNDQCVSKENPICEHWATKLDVTTGRCIGMTDPQCFLGAHQIGDHCEKYSDLFCATGREISTDPASGSARCCPTGIH
ncbi:hypothetical protein BDV41DRAFT_574211 [Aspergillus transmontanensis]|uniref:Uncharacterized protein n=1 Tax=Aspergillus transmontanensis TaxID=1034304 RepID=A0A5N6W6Z7_9EURO|nr:hypothetical protein BDV41DRAFT_574211 [Aspergillus transmontanensis]